MFSVLSTFSNHQTTRTIEKNPWKNIWHMMFLKIILLTMNANLFHSNIYSVMVYLSLRDVVHSKNVERFHFLHGFLVTFHNSLYTPFLKTLLAINITRPSHNNSHNKDKFSNQMDLSNCLEPHFTRTINWVCCD